MHRFPTPAHKARVFVMVAILIFGASVASLFAEPAVLIVHSYSEEYGWSRTLDETLKSELRRDFPDIDVFVEYMDAKRYSVETIGEPFFDFLRAKYDGKDFDVMAVTDNPALELMLSRREELLGQTPLVFSGANDYKPETLEGRRNITGVAEKPDIRGTVDVALELHPEAGQLVAISDSTLTGRINQRAFDRAVDDLREELNVVKLTGLSRSELQERLRGLPPDSVVINLSLFRTADGTAFTVREGSEFVAANTEAPVYAAWDLMLGTGAVGGLVVSSEGQAKEQARLIKEILSGTPADDIPVVTGGSNRYSFDYEALRRHGIDTDELPPGSTIVNEPQSMVYRYGTYILAAVTSIAVLSFLVVALLTNTVRRRAAERRLKESEQKYRRIFESLHDVYFEVSVAEGRILTVSSSVRKFGFSPQQLVGRNVATLDIPAGLRRALSARVKAHGAVEDYEIELRDAGGTPIVASFSAHLEAGDSRSRTGTGAGDSRSRTEAGEKLVGTIRDVSQRRRMEEELKRLHKAIEEAGHAVYITDPRGVIAYVNPAFEKTTGYSRAEAVGSTPKLFSSGTTPDAYYARLWQTINAGKTWREQIVNRRKDGTVYHASQTIAPVLSDGGRIEWFVAIQTDETERVENERQYRLLAENATDMIARHSPDGTFTFVSPASRDLLGYEPHELIGVNSYTLFHPEDLEHIRESHQFITRGPEISTVTYRMRCKDGTYTWLETTSRTVSDDETAAVSEIVTVSRDVGERVKMEHRLKEAKSQAEAASRAKSEFVANVSHEIRTPLNAIMGYAELMRRRTDDETSHRYITIMEDAADTLLKLINDILDLSKVEAGRLDITPEFSDIRELVSSVISLFEAQAREQGVPLQPSVSDDLPPLLYYDNTRMRQILVNLIGNALKFTENGHVSITVTGRHAEHERYNLQIAVEDTGTGIPEETREHIFEAFSQGESHSNRTHGGTGLGLAITHRLLERMGGSIEVETGAEGGSTFRVYLNGLSFRRAELENADTSRESGTPGEPPRRDTARQIEKQGTGVKNGVENRIKDDIDALTPRERESLSRALQERIVAEWKRTQEVKMLDEIANLGQRVEELGHESGIAGIAEIGRRIADAAAESDIEVMERELKRFRDLAQQLDIHLE